MAIYEMEPYEFSIIDTLKDENGDYHIKLESLHRPEDCPYCGSDDIIKYGSKPKAIRDIPMFASRTELIIDNPRFQCKKCNATFFNRYQSIEDGKRITNRLREHIKKQSLLKPFSVIAKTLVSLIQL